MSDGRTDWLTNGRNCIELLFATKNFEQSRTTDLYYYFQEYCSLVWPPSHCWSSLQTPLGYWPWIPHLQLHTHHSVSGTGSGSVRWNEAEPGSGLRYSRICSSHFPGSSSRSENFDLLEGSLDSFFWRGVFVMPQNSSAWIDKQKIL